MQCVDEECRWKHQTTKKRMSVSGMRGHVDSENVNRKYEMYHSTHGEKVDEFGEFDDGSEERQTCPDLSNFSGVAMNASNWKKIREKIASENRER